MSRKQESDAGRSGLRCSNHAGQLRQQNHDGGGGSKSATPGLMRSRGTSIRSSEESEIRLWSIANASRVKTLQLRPIPGESAPTPRVRRSEARAALHIAGQRRLPDPAISRTLNQGREELRVTLCRHHEEEQMTGKAQEETLANHPVFGINAAAPQPYQGNSDVIHAEETIKHQSRIQAFRPSDTERSILPRQRCRSGRQKIYGSPIFGAANAAAAEMSTKSTPKTTPGFAVPGSMAIRTGNTASNSGAANAACRPRSIKSRPIRRETSGAARYRK